MLTREDIIRIAHNGSREIETLAIEKAAEIVRSLNFSRSGKDKIEKKTKENIDYDVDLKHVDLDDRKLYPKVSQVICKSVKELIEQILEELQRE